MSSIATWLSIDPNLRRNNADGCLCDHPLPVQSSVTHRERTGNCRASSARHVPFMVIGIDRRLGRMVALALFIMSLSLGAAGAKPPKLPDKAPVPSEPERQDQPETAPPAAAPLPEPRPQTAKPAETEPEAKTPVTAPAPKPVPPRPAPSAADQMLCLTDLEKLGVTFSKQPPISDPAGCSIANPVTVKNLGSTIGIAPEAQLDCPMALAAARFVKDVAGPEAMRNLGSEIVSINHASAYVCRSRHGTEKLSEHAFGNALDIASFKLKDGRQVDVKANAQAAEQKFLDAVRKAACGPFKTVLGPGSDPDHALHFHFDLAPRRNGGTFCQ